MAKEKKNKVKASTISDILKSMRQERFKLDLREREVQYECTHKKNNGAMNLKKTKVDGVFRCKECGAKLDFRFLAGMKDTDSAKKALKDWKKQGLQFANITKLQMSNKVDGEILTKISKGMKHISWMAEIFKSIMLKDLANKKYKAKKAKRGNNVVITGGGRSIFRR